MYHALCNDMILTQVEAHKWEFARQLQRYKAKQCTERDLALVISAIEDQMGEPMETCDWSKKMDILRKEYSAIILKETGSTWKAIMDASNPD